VCAHGGRIDGYYVCPHHPDAGCNCRKPKPGLLLQAAEEHGLDLRKCVFVGDSLTDQQAALAANCQSILVESGRQGKRISMLSRTDSDMHSVADLSAAVDMILASR
jgi:D-glycero-D-manno-heptose 1,7-bisphosphate phosphatase